MITFIDQVDVQMEDDIILYDQFDKKIMWENMERFKALGKFSKEENKLMDISLDQMK